MTEELVKVELLPVVIVVDELKKSGETPKFGMEGAEVVWRMDRELVRSTDVTGGVTLPGTSEGKLTPI